MSQPAPRRGGGLMRIIVMAAVAFFVWKFFLQPKTKQGATPQEPGTTRQLPEPGTTARRGTEPGSIPDRSKPNTPNASEADLETGNDDAEFKALVKELQTELGHLSEDDQRTWLTILDMQLKGEKPLAEKRGFVRGLLKEMRAARNAPAATTPQPAPSSEASDPKRVEVVRKLLDLGVSEADIRSMGYGDVLDAARR